MKLTAASMHTFAAHIAALEGRCIADVLAAARALRRQGRLRGRVKVSRVIAFYAKGQAGARPFGTN